MGGRPEPILLLLRHGESVFNATSTFTGLLDVPLAERGERQLEVAAGLIGAAGLRPDLIVTSPMLRARRTTDLLLGTLGLEVLPRTITWRLCERDYGSLTGMSKAKAKQVFGEGIFFAMRRTVNGRPPPATERQRATWTVAPVADSGPLVAGMGESLRDVIARVRPVWDEEVRPALEQGRSVFVIAHGNSLRALCAAMEGLDDDEVEGLNIPAGHPLVYSWQDGSLEPRGGRYLDDAAARTASEAIAGEGGT